MSFDVEIEKAEVRVGTKPYISKDGFERVKVVRGFSEIRKLFNDLKLFRCFICGGYVRYMASPRKDPAPASDVDIYCETADVAEQLKSFFSANGLTPKHENEISVTYKDIKYDHVWFGTPTIQLIKPMKEGRVVSVGNMDEVLSNFDFSVIRAGLISGEEALVDADFLHDEKNKILRLKNIHCPISSTLRCMKYSKKGYWLKPTESVKLFLDWQERGDDYRLQIIDYLQKANEGEGLTQKEIDELERLMRID